MHTQFGHLENSVYQTKSAATGQRFVFQDAPDVPADLMEFRIVYRGPLPAQGSGDSRAKEKQAIRKYLHPQLKEWWSQNQDRLGDPNNVASNFDSFGFKFCPIVRKDSYVLGCAIDILFLRRDAPGNLVRSGGDIDNRIKVLFDGLRMPEDRKEIAGAEPQEEETPFFCLLQDDALITEVHVVTDRLLTPVSLEVPIHAVELTVHVTISYAIPSMESLNFTQRYALQAYLKTLNMSF